MCSKKRRITEEEKNPERVKDRSAPFSVQSTCLSHTNPLDFLSFLLLKKKKEFKKGLILHICNFLIKKKKISPEKKKSYIER